MFAIILLISAVVLSTSGQILVQPVVSLISRTTNHKDFNLNSFLASIGPTTVSSSCQYC